MQQLPIPTLRPSALPKLWQCPKYEGEKVAGKYADRGNAMDAVYRAAVKATEVRNVANHEVEFTETVHKAILAADPTAEADTFAPISWAVLTTHVIASGEKIITDEASLKIECLGMKGTADAAVPTLDFSIDLKSGEERDYEDQQAAYAGGFMDKYFTDEWHIYLLYCDLRKVVKSTWSRSNAEGTVREVIARVRDPLAVATPCQYCDWCAHRFVCRARLEGVAWWAGKDPETIDWKEELKSPLKLSQFLQLCDIIAKDNGLRDYARGLALEMINAGTDVIGYAKSFRKGTDYVLPNDVGRWIGDLGHAAVLEAYGRLSADKLRAIWAAKKGDAKFPEEIVQSAPGSTFIRALPKEKPKVEKAPKKQKK